MDPDPGGKIDAIGTTPHPSAPDDIGPRGRGAERPTQIPAKGWKDVFTRVKDEIKHDRANLLAAGVAFYTLVAMVPALIAIVSIYGLVSDPDEISNQVEEFGAALPDSAQNLLLDQLESITTASTAGLGVGAVLGLLTALWTTSSAVKHLIAATNAAYHEEEDRNFFKLRGLALGLTVGAVVFFGASIFVVAALPAVLADTVLGDATRIILSLVRWPGLAIAMILALGFFYRLAPNRDDPRWRWTSPGAVVATLLWIIASIGFSIYTANFGSYNETYGSLGAVIVLMLWLFITAFVVIVGAEINSEAERQTMVDTTQGRPEPMGRRDAHAADSVGATAQDG